MQRAIAVKMVETFAKSSAYRYGDKLSFQVPMGKELSLPGKYSPVGYVPQVTGKRCAVVCPGNGGLIAQLYEAGAKEVVAIEPRGRFHKPLGQVLKLYNEINTPGPTAVFTDWPITAAHSQKLGKFDVILWYEGFDEANRPDCVLDTLYKTINPGGSLTVEVFHGSSSHTSGRINSWRPSQLAWNVVADLVAGRAPIGVPGRLDNSKVYVLSKPLIAVTPSAPPAVAKVEKAPGEGSEVKKVEIKKTSPARK